MGWSGVMISEGQVQTLQTKAGNDHLVKVASVRDPIRALAEFIWNAVDADATKVDVTLEANPLGGLSAVVIVDNGTGISLERASNSFASLGDSWKTKSRVTQVFKRPVHGKAGRGRYRFFSLASQAKWKSQYIDQGVMKALQLSISASDLSLCKLETLNEVDAEKGSGTTVDLSPMKETFDWLSSDGALAAITTIFAPYLLQFPDVIISYNNKKIDPDSVISRSKAIALKPPMLTKSNCDDLVVRVVEWKHGHGDRKVYFGGSTGVVLGAQASGAFAPGFDYSVYAYSKFFDEMADHNLLEMDSLTDPDFSTVLDVIRDGVSDYFRSRQSENAANLIDDLKRQGIYPYSGEPKDAVEKKERDVFDITTHAVASYSAHFRRADSSLKRITLGLLKEAISRNPESVTRILKAVFDLPQKKQNEFSSLLEKTELANIISASNMIADRVFILKTLTQLVFDPDIRKKVRERGQLDLLIRDNTWIFGENFHITIPEVGLTRVMERIAADLGQKLQKRKKFKKLDGTSGRIDAFLGRALPTSDASAREYLLVELKRPSLKIGREELDQLEDYVSALTTDSEFKDTATKWTFILVTSEYDDIVRARVSQSGKPVGLLSDHENCQVWVRTWASIIRDCEARLKFIQDKLEVRVSDSEISEKISSILESLTKRRGNGAAAEINDGEET
jgi:hypothetical protein